MTLRFDAEGARRRTSPQPAALAAPLILVGGAFRLRLLARRRVYALYDYGIRAVIARRSATFFPAPPADGLLTCSRPGRARVRDQGTLANAPTCGERRLEHRSTWFREQRYASPSTLSPAPLLRAWKTSR